MGFFWGNQKCCFDHLWFWVDHLEGCPPQKRNQLQMSSPVAGLCSLYFSGKRTEFCLKKKQTCLSLKSELFSLSRTSWENWRMFLQLIILSGLIFFFFNTVTITKGRGHRKWFSFIDLVRCLEWDLRCSWLFGAKDHVLFSKVSSTVYLWWSTGV